MPYFFLAIYELIIEIFKSFSTKVLKNLPLLTAFLSATVIATGLYITAMGALIDGVKGSVPVVVSEVWGWVMPSNAAYLLSAIYGAKTIKFIYYKNIKALNSKFHFLGK